MYRFICLNGHKTFSAAREPVGRCGEDGCEQQAKLAMDTPAQRAEAERVARALQSCEVPR